MLEAVLFSIYLLIMFVSILILVKTSVNTDDKYNTATSLPKVSIIVPARNEESNIEECISSLISLDYPDFEIIVVEGNSEDKTAELLQSFDDHITLINEPPRPNGWVGKSWACTVGYQKATGEVLLFTDADTIHTSQSLKIMIGHLQHSTGFTSLVTTQKLKSFWEHMVTLVFFIISIAVSGTSGNDQSQFANGQYMMLTRDRYEVLGRHEIVANSIIEDLAFGTHAAKEGYPPKIINHKDLVFARMYNNLSEIIDGFSKNIALGMDKVGIVNSTKTIVVIIWAMFGFVTLPALFWMQSTGRILYLGLILLNYFGFSTLFFYLEQQLSERGTKYVFFFPIYFLMFFFIAFRSIFNTVVRKKIAWKNISYDINKI
ncbi:MAG: glycosyltransferase [Candidatus Heimdallarchaeota archaeon]|nr:glycosyltransferase [Candidatus Heimdallarchaeota archaeon]